MTATVETTTAKPCLALTEDALLSEFVEVMLEWGHYKTAEGLRYPTVAEASGRGCSCKPCRLSRA